MNVPEWLSRRGVELRPYPDGKTWFLVMGGQPQYRLVPIPVRGKFGCAVTETVNGQRMPSDSLADTREGAIQAGLEDLGKALGWTG